MSENCTIYCQISDLSVVPRLLQEHFPALHQSRDAQGALIIVGDPGDLRITPKVFRSAGDDFCRLLLGTRTYVSRLECGNPTLKKTVLDLIVSTKLALGVVVEPAFDVDDRYLAVVFAISGALDGIIFNGQAVLASNGETLIGES